MDANASGCDSSASNWATSAGGGTSKVIVGGGAG